MNTKLTNILLIILLIFNVAFVGTWWMGHRKAHHPMHGAKTETTQLLQDRSKGEMYLIKTLGFDSVQQKKLDNVLENHFKFLDKNMGTYIRIQNDLFNALKSGNDSAYANRCADSMGILKVIMEKELFTHFSAIRAICNTGQQKQFNDLIDNMSTEFVHRHDYRSIAKANQDSL